MCVHIDVRVCVGVWVRGCLQAWVRMCVRACVRACIRNVILFIEKVRFLNIMNTSVFPLSGKTAYLSNLPVKKFYAAIFYSFP